MAWLVALILCCVSFAFGVLWRSAGVARRHDETESAIQHAHLVIVEMISSTNDPALKRRLEELRVNLATHL